MTDKDATDIMFRLSRLEKGFVGLACGIAFAAGVGLIDLALSAGVI